MLNRPLVVTSWYRSPWHSIEAAKPRPGPHTTGLAADIAVSPAERMNVLHSLFVQATARNRAFEQDEFKGVQLEWEHLGIGIARSYMHVDVEGLLSERRGLRPRIWDYPSACPVVPPWKRSLAGESELVRRRARPSSFGR